ncbi:type IV secretion system protein (plasmid) [Thalassospira sp. SM2505]
MEEFCFTCVLTNPLGNQLIGYAERVFTAFSALAFWIFFLGVVLSALYYGIKLIRFSMLENPMDDPAAVLWEIGGACVWGAIALTMMTASTDDAFSVSKLWSVTLDVATGQGIAIVEDLNPDIEPPELATNGPARLIGMYEQTIFYFIEAGFNTGEEVDDSGWFPSFHKLSSSAMSMAYGLIIALLALFLIIYFSYIVIAQILLGGLVVSFGSILSALAAFRLTRGMFFAGLRVMVHAGLVIMAASVAVGFMQDIMQVFVNGAECIRTAGPTATSQCEAQLGMLAELMGAGSDDQLMRLFGATEFFATSVFLIVMAAFMLYLAQSFVSMITGVHGVAGATAAFAAAATSIIAGGIGLGLNDDGKPQIPSDNAGNDRADGPFPTDFDGDGDMKQEEQSSNSTQTTVNDTSQQGGSGDAAQGGAMASPISEGQNTSQATAAPKTAQPGATTQQGQQGNKGSK